MAIGGRAVWWVNHKQTFKEEFGGNYIWAPTQRQDGRKNVFWDNMIAVRPGDHVYSYANGNIQGIGVCIAPAIRAPKPKEFGSRGKAWEDDGWLVRVSFIGLQDPLRPKEHMDVLAPVLPDKYSPIRASGDGNQGAYLARVPDAMSAALQGLLGASWRPLARMLDAAEAAPEAALDTAEDHGVTVIENRTDIGDTQRLSLVLARRGQGVYRKNLEALEAACRVTGVTSLRHLRASHIKPWRLCTDFEKLDGNNGLLLSPHVDHLFDRGFITFADEGTLIGSPALDRDVLERWGIKEGVCHGAFRREQLHYLAHHREHELIR